VYQSIKFEFIVNMKTANALGLICPNLCGRASMSALSRAA